MHPTVESSITAARQPDIQIIIPSAGASSRLGGFPKQEAPLGEQTLWQYLLTVCLPLQYPISLITGYWQPDAPLPSSVSSKHFKNWPQGLGASIAFGVEQTVPPKLGYLIVMADQWGLNAKSLVKFVKQWDSRHIQIAVEEHHAGAPLLVPVALRESLLELSADNSLKKLINGHLTKRVALKNASWALKTEEDLFLMQQISRAKDETDQLFDFG